MEHINQLSKADLERLTLLMEEAAEVQQIVCKIIRHGYTSYHPDDPRFSNRDLLEKELGHLDFAIGLMEKNKDINPSNVQRYAQGKKAMVKQYLHYNEV